MAEIIDFSKVRDKMHVSHDPPNDASRLRYPVLLIWRDEDRKCLQSIGIRLSSRLLWDLDDNWIILMSCLIQSRVFLDSKVLLDLSYDLAIFFVDQYKVSPEIFLSASNPQTRGLCWRYRSFAKSIGAIHRATEIGHILLQNAIEGLQLVWKLRV